MEDHTHAVKLLLKANASLDVRDPNTDNNVLHIAAGSIFFPISFIYVDKGSYKCAKLLCELADRESVKKCLRMKNKTGLNFILLFKFKRKNSSAFIM